MMANYLIKTLADGSAIFTLEEDGCVMMTSDAYPNLPACAGGIDLMRSSCKDYRFYTRNLSHELQFYFLLKNLSGEIIAKSGFFDTAVGMEIGIEWVRKYGYSANLGEPAISSSVIGR